MSRPIREIESDLDDAIKARQAAEKAWDARVVMGNRWDEGWVRAQELDRLKTRVADLSGELRKAQQAALDAALAEPDAICSAKDNEAALERVANRVKPGQVKGLLPEPDATREPATDEQVTEAYISPDIDGRWRDFELGFRAAERFHGIGGSKT